MIEHFKKQVQEGATEMFFYAMEEQDPHQLRIKRHKGTLDSFPTNLEYVRHLTDGMPLFKEKQ
jgi:hypothetical protein